MPFKVREENRAATYFCSKAKTSSQALSPLKSSRFTLCQAFLTRYAPINRNRIPTVCHRIATKCRTMLYNCRLLFNIPIIFTFLSRIMDPLRRHAITFVVANIIKTCCFLLNLNELMRLSRQSLLALIPHLRKRWQYWSLGQIAFALRSCRPRLSLPGYLAITLSIALHFKKMMQ